jgi:hypothetical protein
MIPRPKNPTFSIVPSPFGKIPVGRRLIHPPGSVLGDRKIRHERSASRRSQPTAKMPIDVLTAAYRDSLLRLPSTVLAVMR